MNVTNLDNPRFYYTFMFCLLSKKSTNSGAVLRNAINTPFLYINNVLPTQAEYPYFSADFRLEIFLGIFLHYYADIHGLMSQQGG